MQREGREGGGERGRVWKEGEECKHGRRGSVCGVRRERGGVSVSVEGGEGEECKCGGRGEV